MKYIFILLVILQQYCTSYAQTVNIKIIGIESGYVMLYSLEGEKLTFSDSIAAAGNNNFIFTFDYAENHPGLYRLTFNKNKSLDFVYDGESIEIETNAKNILDSIRVINSDANKLYYEFVKRNKEFKSKSELLQLVLARYPEKDDYYYTTKEKLIQVQEDYLYFVNVTAQLKPKSFIARYARSAQLTVIDPETPPDKYLDYLKSHSLDNVNFFDEDLIYSDAFANKSIEYLTYFRNPQLPLELLKKEFMAAIDSILGKARVNEIVYTHAVEYLLEGFKNFGFDNVINYIVENYVIMDDLCLNQKLGNTLDRRIQQSKQFKPESIVPDIILPDSTGSLINLKDLNNEKTLIIFYASWCSHCQTLMPEIYDKYKNQPDKKFEVLAVSIDTSRTDWLNYIRTNNLDWLNVSDLEGWDGKAAEDYSIYATPTIFLVDNEKKLIRVAASVKEIF